jgi:hypothetical protein
VGGVIGALLVTAVLILAVVGAADFLRTVRAVRRGGGGDRAAALLELAVRGLPARRAQWGAAMLVELDAVPGGRARRRFSLGCVRSAAWMRIAAALDARERGAHRRRAGLLAGVAVALALPVYGLVRYPALGAGRGMWAAAAVLVATLLLYAVCAWALLRGATAAASAARRRAVLAGVAVGAAWLLVLAPGALKQWVLAPLVFALACPIGVAVRTRGGGGTPRRATAAALASGLVGGLLVFVAWATATYLRSGRPYDPQLVRDFHASGARDLASYAVADDLVVALSLLILVPIACSAFGCVAAIVTRPRQRESTR